MDKLELPANRAKNWIAFYPEETRAIYAAISADSHVEGHLAVNQQSDVAPDSCADSETPELYQQHPVPKFSISSQTVLRWTWIGSFLFLLASLTSAIHLWIWINCTHTYFKHWQIVLVDDLPTLLFLCAITAMFVYGIIVMASFILTLQVVIAGTYMVLARKVWQIIVCFIPPISCLGIPLLLTEFVLLLRQHPYQSAEYSHRQYLKMVRKIRNWSISWIFMWILLIAQIVTSSTVRSASAALYNNEFRIILFLLLAIHIWYSYKNFVNLGNYARGAIQSYPLVFA